MNGGTPSFDLTSPQAVALRDALTNQREDVLHQLGIALALRPEIQTSSPASDAGRRLATVFYGNMIAALTFHTFSTFERDIRWHLSLARRRNLNVTLNDERALCATIADAISHTLPDHAQPTRALLAHIAALIATIRESEECRTTSTTSMR